MGLPNCREPSPPTIVSNRSITIATQCQRPSAHTYVMFSFQTRLGAEASNAPAEG